MYGKLEEDYGLARHAMRIYDRATKSVSDEDRFEVSSISLTEIVYLIMHLINQKTLFNLRCLTFISPKLVPILV